MNPYEELGVEKTATSAQIKKAYRKRAQQLHPDKGGDKEAFQRLNAAHEILSDESARKRYDETGETGRPVEDDLTRDLVQLMTQVIDQTHDVEHANIVELMRARLKEAISQNQAQKGKVQVAINKRSKVLSLLKIREGEHNLLADALTRDVALGGETLMKIDEVISRLWKLIDRVDAYSYSVSAPTTQWSANPFTYTTLNL
jgi:hypothetical protein